MAHDVIASFGGPLSGFAIELSVVNTSGIEVKAFGISGRTARFPITFDSMGMFSGPATLTGVSGVNTEVIIAHLNGFTPDETVRFEGIDPDFTGDNSSGVRVFDLEGCRFLVIYADGSNGSGEFAIDDEGTLRAVALHQM